MIDLDGTLLDTIQGLTLAINLMLIWLDYPPLQKGRIAQFVGKGVFNLVRLALTDAHGGTPDEALFERAMPLFMNFYDQTYAERTQPYVGVIEGLEALRTLELPLACVTNTITRFTMPLLKQHGLEQYFGEVISGDTLPKKKPDPLPLTHTAMTLGFAIRDVLMIGDSLNDVEAARSAGCPVFCVDYGYNEGLDIHAFDVDAMVGSLLEASKLIIKSSQV